MMNMNPDQLMEMVENPLVQQMMQQLVEQNPDAIRQSLEAQNPMFRHMFAGNPEMANNMVRQMMNPEALRGMLQMQRAMGGAGAGAGAMPGMGMPGMGSPPPGGMDFSSLLGGQPPGSGPAPGGPDFSTMMQQMQAMMGGGGAAGAPFGMPSQQMQQQQQQQHPADRYRSQLNSLRDMGFDDEQQCLAVLQQNHGNLNRAVDALLMGPPVPVPAASSSGSNESTSTSTSTSTPPLPDPKNDQDKKDD